LLLFLSLLINVDKWIKRLVNENKKV